MIYFTSDTHLFHTNIIKYSNRPFENTYYMNKHIIKSWNKVVSPEDDIYFLGDFALKSNINYAKSILSILNGKKYFLKGNHDKIDYLEDFQNSKLIEWWKYSHDFSFEFEGETYNFSLSHYPHYPLKGSDLICLHGHSHGASEHRIKHFPYKGVLDVGVDSVGYEPISIIKIIEIIERQRQQ